ncbi:flagellar motor protein MotD [Simiduia sp. 21SJ11W-1]|uniref:flagellar motor protein MotD n=1 Tax=Simiduia sp. 21SJ11W-1 TaxID=2909669 RepID=UPI0020A11E9C|nr:flagellar motor protein MotD [Simiduia sp. 21SJ11W-1]UTA49509.1 flagellar motor protein MotD [Simiduia sp. 21SJ11W-1]
MPRRRPAQLAVNHERWLVSYADFITLLFAFFVVMYSVSQVSETKYRVLSDTLVSTFKFQSQTINPIQVGQPSLSSDPSVIDTQSPKTGEEQGDGAFQQDTDLPHMAENLRTALSDLIERDLVDIKSNEYWLEIALNSNVLFGSASADPSRDAQLIFAEIAKHLTGAENPIQVEGYTDDQPIRTDRFPSNWELSAARASAVVKLLQQQNIAPDRLSAVGYGEHRPIADNSTEAGRAQNRRVSLMIAKSSLARPEKSLIDALDDFSGKGDFTNPGAQILPKDLSGTDNASPNNDDLQPATAEGDNGAGAPANSGPSEEGHLTTRRGLQAIKLESGGILFTSDPARLEQAQEQEQNN